MTNILIDIEYSRLPITLDSLVFDLNSPNITTFLNRLVYFLDYVCNDEFIADYATDISSECKY